MPVGKIMNKNNNFYFSLIYLLVRYSAFFHILGASVSDSQRLYANPYPALKVNADPDLGSTGTCKKRKGCIIIMIGIHKMQLDLENHFGIGKDIQHQQVWGSGFSGFLDQDSESGSSGKKQKKLKKFILNIFIHLFICDKNFLFVLAGLELDNILIFKTIATGILKATRSDNLCSPL
jgi:hypothetical protein